MHPHSQDVFNVLCPPLLWSATAPPSSIHTLCHCNAQHFQSIDCSGDEAVPYAHATECEHCAVLRRIGHQGLYINMKLLTKVGGLCVIVKTYLLLIKISCVYCVHVTAFFLFLKLSHLCMTQMILNADASRWWM